MRWLRRVAVGLIAAGVALGGVGCSSDDTAKQIAAMNKSNIQRLSNVYAAYQNGKGGSGPKDEADFKDFIRAYDPAKLSAMGIDPGDLDKAFTSERDGKPFKIKYAVPGGRGSVAPVVFEQDGAGGTKQVGFTGGTVEDVDDAKYKELWAGKGAAPAGGPPTGPNSSRPKGPPPGAPKGPKG